MLVPDVLCGMLLLGGKVSLGLTVEDMYTKGRDSSLVNYWQNLSVFSFSICPSLYMSPTAV